MGRLAPIRVGTAAPRARPLAPPWVAWTVGIATCLTLPVAGWLDWRAPGFRVNDTVDWITGVAAILASAGVGMVLASRRGENPIGWLLLALAAAMAHFGLTEPYVSSALAHPGSLPGARLVANWDRATWPLIFAPIVAIVFLFPAGPPPLARWWLIKWVAVLSFAAVIVSGLLAGDPLKAPFDSLEPYHVLPRPAAAALEAIGLAGMVATFALAAWSVRRRFRDADQVTRAQLKWLVYASTLVPLAIVTAVIEVVLSSSGEPGFVTLALILALLIVLPGSIGVAVMRYHLFDIEVVINRTLVYGALTLCLAVAYVTLVAGLDAFLGSRGVAGVLGAVAIAVAVQPLRERLQRYVDRRLYGYRSDPYEAMRLLGDRLHATLAPGQVLKTIVESVAEALRVPYVGVEFMREGERETAAVHGTLGRARVERRPLLYQGEQVAELVLGVPTGRDLTDADRQLLEDLAAQAGDARVSDPNGAS